MEYPQSGSVNDEAVAHIFQIDPSKSLESFDPRKNVQYSLGGIQGMCHNVECFLLTSSHNGCAMFCDQKKIGCKFNSSVIKEIPLSVNMLSIFRYGC